MPITMHHAHRATLLALAMLTVAGGASAADQPIRLSIAPGKVGEVCMALAVGDTLNWRFKASQALDFNLHHHVGNKVLMPIERKAVVADTGQHRIDQRNDWCLMWTAARGGEAASVEGAWSVQAAAAKQPP